MPKYLYLCNLIQKIMHIAVAGNIGSGKSTLTRLLAKHYGWEPRFESVDSNPYLDDYYRDIHRWSFNMEVFFLKERFRDLIDIAKADHTIIQDRTIYEGVHVFMENNREMGNLSERDYETYMELFEQMMSVVKLPDLMIYLRASVPHLVSNIQKRGRDYEQAIQLEYLQNLNCVQQISGSCHHYRERQSRLFEHSPRPCRYHRQDRRNPLWTLLIF